MSEDTSWMKLSTEDKCTSKLWKARVAGYDEAIQLFKRCTDPKSSELSGYLGLVRKFVVESNAIAQEKAVEATLVFVKTAAVAPKSAGEVMGGVVTKCLASTRAKTREFAAELVFEYIEAEKQEVVQEELMKGFQNKQPKVVTASVTLIKDALSQFGSKIIMMKPLLKLLQKVLEDRDRNVRDSGKLLVVELYRWIGPPLKNHINFLKPAQLAEFETEFENIPPGKPSQTRFLRSQQDLKQKMEEAEESAEAAAMQDGDDDEEEDLFDAIEAVNILNKLPKDYYKNLDSAKWQTRKESLVALEKLVEALKFEPGDYHDVVKSVKTVIAKDKNIMLVTIAVKCVGALARGLKKTFSTHSIQCLDVLLEKFKEKKPQVVAAIREAVDYVYLTTNLDAMSESLMTALEHKNPIVKAETAAFMARCFSTSNQKTLPKKLLKIFIASLLKIINDTSPDVRDNGFKAIGVLLKVIGEKPLSPFLADVDSIKMAKIQQCAANCSDVKSGGDKTSATAATKKAEPLAKSEPSAAKSASTLGAKKKTLGKPPSSKSATAVSKTSKKNSSASNSAAPTAAEFTENILSDDAVIDKTTSVLPVSATENLSSSNWKERLESAENFKSNVSKMEKNEIHSQAFVRTILNKPGLKDTNVQVLRVKVDIIKMIADNSNFSKTTLSFCLNPLVDKIGDAKNGAAVREALTSLSENVGLSSVASATLDYAFGEQKNPKVQQESLAWMSQALKEFGLKVEVKKLLTSLKKALSATNPAVRTSALSFMGVLYLYIGAQLRFCFEGEKPALLALIDASFAKMEGETAPAPTRGISDAAPPGVCGSGSGDVKSHQADEEDDDEPVDIMPRICIKDQITEDIVTKLKDKNWKVRGESLNSISSLISSAKFITADVGADLIPALVSRMADTNKNLVVNTLNICKMICTSMGPGVKQHIKMLAPGIISTLADSKPNVRKCGVATLIDWIQKSSMNVFLECEILCNEMKSDKPNLKIELLVLLKILLVDCKRLSTASIMELEMCCTPFYACLEDRNPEVRKSAQDAIVPIMSHVGYVKMSKKISTVKAASKDLVLALLDKARDQVPKDAPSLQTKNSGGGGGAGGAAASAKAKSSKVKKPPANTRTVSPPSEPNPGTNTAVAASAPSTNAAKKTIKKIPGKAPAKRKMEEIVDEGAMLSVVAGSKEQRIKDERQLKILKWNFKTPRLEFVDQLKLQMSVSIGKTLIDNMYHANFKFHLKAIETLTKELEYDNAVSTICNVDMILKWLTLRFFDTNTSVFLKLLDYCKSLFLVLERFEYSLTDLEANSFIPYLINKVGDPKDNIRKNIRQIFRLITNVYPAQKFFNFILEGLKSKNSKQRMECLDDISVLLRQQGLSVLPHMSVLKVVASQISDRDNPVRSAALNAIVSAYVLLQDDIYKHIGKLPDKEMGMLEERIKRSIKSGEATVASLPATDAPKSKSANNARVGSKARMDGAGSNGGGGAGGAANATGGGASGTANPRRSQVAPPAPVVNHGADMFAYAKLSEPLQTYQIPTLEDQTSTDQLYNSNNPRDLIKTAYQHTLLKERQQLEDLFSCLSSEEHAVACEAFQQVFEIIDGQDKYAKIHKMLMEKYSDFCTICVSQLKFVYAIHIPCAVRGDINFTEVFKLYRYVISCLSRCDVKLPMSALKPMLYCTFEIVTDKRTKNQAGHDVLQVTINKYILRMLNHCDRTNVICAAFQIMSETFNEEKKHICNLAMRAIWKLNRYEEDWVDNVDLSLILQSLDSFLIAHPMFEDASSDPMKTIKTFIHSLTSIVNKEIYNHFDKVVDHQNSDLIKYIHKSMKSLDKNDFTNFEAKKALQRIFTKIKSSKSFHEGIEELFVFKTNYPKVDLNDQLSQCMPELMKLVIIEIKAIENRKALCQQRNLPEGDIEVEILVQAKKLQELDNLAVPKKRQNRENIEIIPVEENLKLHMAVAVEKSRPVFDLIKK